MCCGMMGIYSILKLFEKQRRKILTVEQIHTDAKIFVLEQLKKMHFPSGHPFNDYPNTPESMALELIVLIEAFTQKRDMVVSFLDKCKGLERGSFSFIKFNQGISEAIWFYYLYSGLIKSNALNILVDIYDENKQLFNNDKKFEFSFLLSGFADCLVASEVKAITCDPFEKEDQLKNVDGQKLIKPLFPNLRESNVLCDQSENIVLKASTYYYQLGSNIKKIVNKCKGNNISGHDIFSMGTIFINASTSFEEFYSYLFHKTYGIYTKLLASNLDALVFVSLDAKNDMMLNNIYEMGYVQTALINPTEKNKQLCEIFRLDNYISFGRSINKEVYEKGQREFGYYKILCRDGFVNIIPQDASESEIEEYLKYLKGSDIRSV